jgi:hypothetical protein
MTRVDSVPQKAARSLPSGLMATASIDKGATAHTDAHRVEVEGFTDMEPIRSLADLFQNLPGEMSMAEETVGAIGGCWI